MAKSYQLCALLVVSAILHGSEGLPAIQSQKKNIIAPNGHHLSVPYYKDPRRPYCIGNGECWNMGEKITNSRQEGMNNGGGNHHSSRPSQEEAGPFSNIFSIEGLTYGEFLREYAVHNIYDFIFVICKWLIFFIAGRIIP